MKTMIGLPCMDNTKTVFTASILGMRRVGETHYNIKKGSLVYDARNEIAIDAIVNETDRILWIDSDMKFKPDMMERLSARIDQGCEMVCGLFFKRVFPTQPVIYKELLPPIEKDTGEKVKQIQPYIDYPEDSLFEVQGCGFGAVMMTTQLVKDVWDHFNMPAFMPLDWCGEDMAFCYKVRMLGRKIWCDSSIKVGHIGEVEFNEETWKNQVKQGISV